MFFLQINIRSTKVNCIMPSPTNKTVNYDLKSRSCKIIPKMFARKISLFSSLKKKVKAGMTVEAACILPFFLFFFLHLAGYIEMLRLYGKLEFALWDAGKQLAVYTAVSDCAEIEIPDIAVSYVYVQGNTVGLLGQEYLNTSPLVYGVSGLNFLSSEYSGDIVDIGVTYRVEPKITIFPFAYMSLANRYYGRVWNGYDVEKEVCRYVYVTIYGEVWHEATDCRYIHIDVYAVPKSRKGNLRNDEGKKYRLCELCEEKEWGTSVYYTLQGECYHKDRNCSSLVRYIRAIEWREDLPYRKCSKCVEEE